MESFVSSRIVIFLTLSFISSERKTFVRRLITRSRIGSLFLFFFVHPSSFADDEGDLVCSSKNVLSRVSVGVRGQKNLSRRFTSFLSEQNRRTDNRSPTKDSTVATELTDSVWLREIHDHRSREYYF